MNANLKSLCTLSILRDIETYGAYRDFSDFAKIARNIIELQKKQLDEGDIVPFVDNQQVSDILFEMGIQGTVEDMESDGVMDRNSYIHDGFFFADALFSDMESQCMSEIYKEQLSRTMAF